MPEGYVISQDPDEGTLFKSETVSLLVSLGPELVEVPNVVASGVDDATATLEAAGFVVDVQNSPGFIGLMYVLSQDPEAGTELPKGSTLLTDDEALVVNVVHAPTAEEIESELEEAEAEAGIEHDEPEVETEAAPEGEAAEGEAAEAAESGDES